MTACPSKILYEGGHLDEAYPARGRLRKGEASAITDHRHLPLYPFSTRLWSINPTPETAFTAAQKSELETIVAKAVGPNYWPTRAPPRPLGVPLNHNFD